MLAAETLWSNPASWPSGECPKDGEDVTIESGTNMVFDLEGETPVYRLLRVNGRLSFQNKNASSTTAGTDTSSTATTTSTDTTTTTTSTTPAATPSTGSRRRLQDTNGETTTTTTTTESSASSASTEEELPAGAFTVP